MNDIQNKIGEVLKCLDGLSYKQASEVLAATQEDIKNRCKLHLPVQINSERSN